MSTVIPITELKPGQTGKIVEISGGCGICQKLSTRGLRIGSGVTKVSSTFQNGPVTLQSGNCQIAIGFGQAQRVLVEVAEE